MSKKNAHFVLEGFDYVKSIPCYESNLNGKDFPIFMSNDRVAGSKLWVCVAAGRISKEDSDAVAKGKFGQSRTHVHTADSAYVIVGEPESVTAEVLLGGKKYTLKPPSSVFIPTGMPHSIRPTAASQGLWGGVFKVYYDGRYEAEPAEAWDSPARDTDKYVTEGFRWTAELAAHTGSDNDKGYPVILSSEFVPEAKTWICPALSSRSPEVCAIINSGKGPEVTLHVHDNGDEIYMILGDEDSVTIRVTLGDEDFIVKPPTVVYIPTNMPHCFVGTHVEPGKFGGPCALFSGDHYNPIDC